MAKIQPSGKNRKLTAVGYAHCAESLQATHPTLAAIMQDRQQLDNLENVLRVHTLDQVIQKTNSYLDSQEVYAEAAAILRPAERKQSTEFRTISSSPVGTAEWVFDTFPESKAHFCNLMLDAGEAETTLRDLVANYNFVGMDPEDIPGMLNFVNNFCNVLRPLSEISDKRERAIIEAVRQERRNNGNQLPPDRKQAA